MDILYLLLEMQGFLCVLIHNVCDTNYRDDFQEIWGDTFEESANALLADRFLKGIKDAIVSLRMQNSSLNLKSSA